MLKFLILDVYPSDNWRLVKDTAGGYGTGNNFGNSFLSKLMNFFVSKSIAMPPMSALYVYSIIKGKNCIIEYTKKILPQEELKNFDYIILPSSIIAHETEIETLNFLNRLGLKVFVIGIFGNIKKNIYNLDNSYVVKGEPEKFFLENKLEKKNLDNFFSNQNLGLFENRGEFVEILDDLPYPSWDIYLKKYPLRNNFLSFNKKSAIPILASRGCPYSCFNYCTYPLQQGRKVRYRSVKNIINEIIHWKNKVNTNKFVFRDPVFSINRKFTVELCNEIIKKKLNIEFLIETHLNNLDDELIKLLKDAGLKIVYIGVESVEEKVLKDINRFSIKNDAQFKIINKLSAEGIIVKSMYMIGNPEDTEETIKNTISYSKLLPNQLVQFSIFTPYPGTPIFKKFENIITTSKFENFNQYNLVFKHNYLNEKQINYFKNYAYRKFYLHYKNLGIVFKTLKSFFI